MKCIIIDNYDSFTYNLVHLLRELGAEVTVKHNDAFALEEIEEYDRIVLSPGPGVPSEAGLMPEVIRHYAATRPMLGVCLGHQAIAEAFGGKIEKLPEVFHGVGTLADVDTHSELFSGLPSQIKVGRYHSWVVERESVSSPLEITAISCTGEVMGIRHQQLRLHGIQFHPESILTPNGRTIMNNWLHKG